LVRLGFCLFILCYSSLEYLRKGLPYPPSGYEELDVQINSNHDHYNRITSSPGDCYGELLQLFCFFFICIKLIDQIIIFVCIIKSNNLKCINILFRPNERFMEY